MNCVAVVAAIRTARIVNFNNVQHPLRELENFMKCAIIGSGKIGTALGCTFPRRNIEVGVAAPADLRR